MRLYLMILLLFSFVSWNLFAAYSGQKEDRTLLKKQVYLSEKIDWSDAEAKALYDAPERADFKEKGFVFMRIVDENGAEKGLAVRKPIKSVVEEIRELRSEWATCLQPIELARLEQKIINILKNNNISGQEVEEVWSQIAAKP